MAGFLSLQWNNHSLAFLNLLNSLHSKELYCDATIACHGKFYPVHRMVLSTCSEYFQEIFNLTQCKHPFIIVNDAQPSELEALLKYMYKGNINVPQNELPNLLKAAEALRIKGLAVPDKLFTDKESPKKRSSSQNSSAKKLKVMNKEKSHNDARRSVNDSGGEAPPMVGSDDDKDSIIEEPLPIKEEPIAHEDDEQIIKNKLGQEYPSNIDVGTVKDEPYDPSYSDAPVIQEELQYPNNTEWPTDIGASAQTNQQSFTGRTLIENRNEVSSSNNLATAFPFASTSAGALNAWLYGKVIDDVSQKQEIFRCLQCPYKCRFKGNLRRHVKQVHTRERPFTCSLCPYRSVSKDTMILHIRKHTGEKPFPCLLCGVRFSAQSNHNRHMKLVHNSSRDKF